MRGVEDAAPYRWYIEMRWLAGGPMHPKGTCSASLHCVGIAPYEGYTEVRRLAGGGVWSPRPTEGAPNLGV